jgi:hypothetical protein
LQKFSGIPQFESYLSIEQIAPKPETKKYRIIKKQNKNGKQQRTGSGNREPKHS